MRRFLIGTMAAALAISACTGVGGGPVDPARLLGSRLDPSRVTFAAALTPFSACDAVLDHFKAEALERVGPYGLEGMSHRLAFRGATPFAERDVPQAASRSSADGASATYSGTNVQVAGVDEPDIVKTDGSRILSVVDGVLRYVVVDGDSARVVGSLRLEAGWGHRILVAGERALVFSSADIVAVPFAEDRIGSTYPAGRPQARIVEVDLSDPAAMRVARTMTVDGRYLSARAVDGTVRVVVSSHPELPFVFPSSPDGEPVALEANRRVIAESTVEQWLPSFTVTDSTGSGVSGLAVPCHRMHRPAEFSGFSTLSVITLDLDEPLAGGTGTGVIASGETVYASAESLYVATTVWASDDAWVRPEGRAMAEAYSTAIHRFSIDGDGVARYRASGSVPGHLLDQFSLDEHDGVLRVAVTEGPPWGFDDRSESKVVVLAERDGALVEIGSVGGMGRGERIFSVRFIGEVAYVVTFRQVDPFYVVDLRDPAAPRVAGELKIEGYSAYLHPIGDGLVLGVGQDADSQGMTLGAKATLFDVTDPANPRQVATWRARNAHSDVEWDHLAFLAWAPADIVVLPIQSWSERFAGVVVLGTADGLTEAGRITHAVDQPGGESDCEPVGLDTLGEVRIQLCGEDDRGGLPGHVCEFLPEDELKYWDEGAAPEIEVGPGDRIELCWPDPWMFESPILRSIVIGDTLWTLSSAALQGNDVDDLDLVQRIDFRR